MYGWREQDAQEKEFSQILVQALTPAIRLDLLPKSSIDVYVNVLENDGTSSCLAAAISAASVALADAGIEMYDQVAASSIVSTTGVENTIRLQLLIHNIQAYVQDKIVMDPSAVEEENEDGSLVVSYMPSLNEVTHILQTGNTETATTSRVRTNHLQSQSSLLDVNI
jgi:exosome complex component MTR3